MQMHRTDEMSLPLRKRTLGCRGMSSHQILANNKPKDRIAQELQLLVIASFRQAWGML